MTFRYLARASAAGLLAAGALAVAATPALAADVDFGLELKGSTIALGVGEKPATVNFANLGTSKPDEVRVLFDATDLKPSIGVDLGSCQFEDGIADCVIDKSAIPGPGETADLPVPLVVEDGSERGNQGKLTITVVVEGDTNKANDSRTVDVVLSEESGVDLRVLAPDVTAVDNLGNPTGKPLQPGERSTVFGYIANHGDVATNSLKITVKLPKDVTFVENAGGCEYNAAATEVTCLGGGFTLEPWDQVEDKNAASFVVPLEVKLSEQAKGPAAIAGGTWRVVGSNVYPLPSAQRKAKQDRELPAFGRPVTDTEIFDNDVDPTDNTDGFSVLVAGAAGGAGGGAGDDGGLPVTGPVAASVAGAGAAALAVGAFLFISARRRRIVLVTPGDGK
jgi:hypothetical protein